MFWGFKVETVDAYRQGGLQHSELLKLQFEMNLPLSHFKTSFPSEPSNSHQPTTKRYSTGTQRQIQPSKTTVLPTEIHGYKFASTGSKSRLWRSSSSGTDRGSPKGLFIQGAPSLRASPFASQCCCLGFGLRVTENNQISTVYQPKAMTCERLRRLACSLRSGITTSKTHQSNSAR